MGSISDEERMAPAGAILEKFGVPFDQRVISAHRNPGLLSDYAAEVEERGIAVIIAGAGKAAALPGLLAAHTVVPVIGVPIYGKHVSGLDSLLSIVQMPSGVPVATVGLDAAANAAVLAVQMLALSNPDLRRALWEFKEQLAEGLRF